MPSPVQMIKRQLNRSTHRLYTLPILILLPHSKCNCRCVMCDIWKANRAGQEITAEQLAPHLAQIRKLKPQQIVLSGGEALMHSNLWALCEALGPLNAKITLLSTGLLLKRHAENVVRWCDEVIVSLDGDRDTHDAIRRVPRAYDRLAEGITALRALQPDFHITARCVLQNANYAILPAIISAAHDLGLNQISFLGADVSTEAFNRPDAWDSTRIDTVALSVDQIAEFYTVLEIVVRDCAADFDSGFIAESPQKLRRIAQYYAALNGLTDFPTVTCNAPWVSTVIEADGTVRPCFFHAEMGNLNEAPLTQIINSPAAVNFRRELDVSKDPICRKCVCTLNLGTRADL
jgi:Fe-coproporphyrin III synthase